MHTIVGIMLINAAGQVLLLHREKDPAIYAPDKWGLVGGHVEPGESLDEAIRRETREEIGLDLAAFRPFVECHDAEYERYIYIGPIDKRLDELILGEGQDMGFFQPAEALCKLDLTDPTRTCLGAYLRVRLSVGWEAWKARRATPACLISRRAVDFRNQRNRTGSTRHSAR